MGCYIYVNYSLLVLQMSSSNVTVIFVAFCVSGKQSLIFPKNVAFVSAVSGL